MHTISLVVSAWATPLAVRMEKSVLPCTLPSAFHVLCPCRTKTIRFGLVILGRGSGVKSCLQNKFRSKKEALSRP